jgi:hypothetical protein
MKKVIVFVLGFLFLTLSVYSQAPITFRLEDVESRMPYPEENISTPWCFDADDPGLSTHDSNPFTRSPEPGYAYHNHAYKWFYSIALENSVTHMGPTHTWCTSEILDYVNGTEGFRIEFEQYGLTAFEKLNTVNPGAAWNIAGQAGDKRIYTGGIGRVFYNDPLDEPDAGEQLVLELTNCVLTAYVHYPNAQQMRDLGFPFNNWQNDVGTGEATIAEGWGFVNLGNSNPAWVNTFANPAAGNRVDFEMSSMNHVLQGFWGYYDFDLSLIPANHDIQMNQAFVPINPFAPILIEFPELDVSFDFFQAFGGGVDETLNHLNVLYHQNQPLGNFPVNIESVIPRFWEFSTDLGVFTTAIIFDLNGMNFGDSNHWQILRKENLQNDWVEWVDVTILDANRIQANNVSAFSEWTIGSIDEEPLPVTLNSFTAIFAGTSSVLQWITQSESNNSGWNIYRSEYEAFSSSIKINEEMINGAGTTGEMTEYNFVDESEFQFGKTYYYWLESVDYANITHLYGPVIVQIPEEQITTPEIPLSYGLYANYPNPFNPSTQISFALNKTAHVNLTVYDVKGRIIRSILSAEMTLAEQVIRVTWDGKDETGKEVGSGVYFYRLKAGSKDYIRKMLLIK